MANICVFCSSTNGVAKVYEQAAVEVGVEIARRGHELVYGGSNLGLMGKVARATQENKGRVIGVIPEMFKKYAGGEDEVHYTKDLRDRKALMEEKSHGFLILPGGIGTLDETGDVFARKQLEFHDKPIALLNTNKFYHHFIAHMKRMERERFASPNGSPLYFVANTPMEAIDFLEKNFTSKST